MYRYWTRLSLGAVASAAVIVVGFASTTGSAYAEHDINHTTGPKTVFVTSGVFTGDFRMEGGAATGLRGGDNICQAASERGVVPPAIYIAWLSTPAKDAIDRLPANTSGYFLPSGTKVADDKADLVTCPPNAKGDYVCLDHPINEDEFGNVIVVVASVTPVWTGTLRNGTFGYSDCDGWAAGAGASGWYGRVHDKSLIPGDFDTWTSYSVTTCGSTFHLYCFQR